MGVISGGGLVLGGFVRWGLCPTFSYTRLLHILITNHARAYVRSNITNK